ncbi:hypothetical protein [Mycobacterium lacus]|uniref:Uncharacterized protein n=1 Tax=Mycobacterium lacus TaxID=169765 RepID=A0A7I7NIA3_9MYCO|nr:hypothetical protein [Mycobacterium lacus]MCV7124774.1 hypothetical protein [Mycobacterium lacus]BBX96376.1 hypothetical protein MLAC_16700 [Mycobacterium lacus]
MKTKVVVVVIGGIVALTLLLRYFTLSRAGMPVGWMLYLGLPVTAAGVLFALLLVDLGAGWGVQEHSSRAGPRPRALPLPMSRVSERLRELEDPHVSTESDCGADRRDPSDDH